MNKTIVVSDLKTGKHLFRLPNATIRADGTIWDWENKMPLIITRHLPNKNEIKERYTKAKNLAKEVNPDHLAKLGIIGEGSDFETLVETEEELERRKDAEKANAMFPRTIEISAKGELYIEHDIREAEDFPHVLEMHGLELTIGGFGKHYKKHLHTVRRAYVDHYTIVNDCYANQKHWQNLANYYYETYHHAFNAMMEDGNNDGARPPSSAKHETASKIAEEICAIKDDVRPVKVLLSTRGWGDFSPVYWTGKANVEKSKFLEEARDLLSSAVDVDKPKQSDEELLGLLKNA